MFGFRFAKFQPSEYVMKIKNGRVVKEGVGLAFHYYAPTTSVVVVPVSSIDVPFMFDEMTSDYQKITVQGQLIYRIAEYRRMTEVLNYTYDLKKNRYLSDDPALLSQRVVNIVKVRIKRGLAQMPLREAIQASETLAQSMRRELANDEELAALGVELMGLSILAILPNKDTMRALEAKAREEILQDADEALYRRRNASIEQERAVKENELNTEIAVETKKRQIRETQLNAERAVKQKRHEMEEEQLRFDIDMEGRKQDLIGLETSNRKTAADAKAYELTVVMKSLESVDPQVLQAMANMDMKPDKLIALAFRELADNAGKIGQLNITPDLLQGLMGDHAKGAVQR